MSVNMKPIEEEKVLGKGHMNPSCTSEQIDQIVDQTLLDQSYASDECYRKIANILFESET